MGKRRKKGKWPRLADVIGKPTVTITIGTKSRIIQPRRPLPEFLVGTPVKRRVVDAPCSCQGQNERCFKCSGTGIYEREMAAGAVRDLPSLPEVHTRSMPKTSHLSTFASDPKGNGRAIRENGRFSSLPLHDDYDEESTS